MDIGNLNNFLMTDASVASTSQLQNTTFLQNVFITTFLATLSFEGFKYFLGEGYQQTKGLVRANFQSFHGF